MSNNAAPQGASHLQSTRPRLMEQAATRGLDMVLCESGAECRQTGVPFEYAARRHGRHPKQRLTIRLDADILKWVKAQGRGYQTRINRILRAAMESQSTRRTGSTAAVPKKDRSRNGLKPA